MKAQVKHPLQAGKFAIYCRVRCSLFLSVNDVTGQQLGSDLNGTQMSKEGLEVQLPARPGVGGRFALADLLITLKVVGQFAYCNACGLGSNKEIAGGLGKAPLKNTASLRLFRCSSGLAVCFPIPVILNPKKRTASASE